MTSSPKTTPPTSAPPAGERGVGTTPVLRLVDVRKEFAGAKSGSITRALDGVNLEVARDDLLVIIGRSGAGKSTLLRCINLLGRPTSGRIELVGEDITRAGGRRVREVRGRVAMIFQGFNLVRRMSVIENVMIGRLRRRTSLASRLGALAGVFSRSDKLAALGCLQSVGIESLAFRRADTLSGGQQQRVAIARALAQEPEIILADEPVASLDPRSAHAVMTILADIHRSRGTPVIVNLHQVDLAREYATRIVGMAAGRIRFDTSPAGLADADLSSIYDQADPTAPASSEEPTLVSRINTMPTGPALAGSFVE